jgi:hypothetical protein
MANLSEAIGDFQDSLAKVYRAQSGRITRDANAARRSAKDYTGRWFFELVQNCEDARATEVVVRVADDTIHIADDGDGFRPEAVESISGTDSSDKPVGAIGRKGVGFKAVYEITTRPQVFTSGGEGLEFNARRAAGWFQDQGIQCSADRMPYEWVPFFVSRTETEDGDAVLRDLQGYATVVKLPLKSKRARELALGHLQAWPAYALLPFAHVGKVRVSGGKVPFEISVQRDQNRWVLNDSRHGGSTVWRASRHTSRPSAECTAELDPGDRERVKEVGFLVAACVGADGCVEQAPGPLPLHVFYPTEQVAPVRLLLHAEFLVKSDRTAVLPPSTCLH